MDNHPARYRSLSPEEAQRIGQRLFRSESYEDALEAFTAVSHPRQAEWRTPIE